MGKSRLFCMVIAALVISLGLIACGGGGGGDSSPPVVATSAQGFWSGSTTGHTLNGAILDDGTYYVMYFSPGMSYVPDGFIQGYGTSSNGVFTSSNARNFNFTGAGVLTATFSGTYTEKQFLAGVFNYADGSSAPFSAAYDSAYETAPLLSSLVGTYTGAGMSTTGFEYSTMSIAANGDFMGVGASGCTASGRLTPRTHGNVFDATVTSGASCSQPNLTFSGAAVYIPSLNGVYVLVSNPARTYGAIFVGYKP